MMTVAVIVQTLGLTKDMLGQNTISCGGLVAAANL